MKTLALVLVLIFAALSLSACAVAGVGDSGTETVPQGGTTADVCPSPSAGTQLLRNEAFGYCLLYPNGYDVEQPNENETVLVVGSLLNVEQPRAYIEVREAAGRSAAQVAEESVATLPSGFEVERAGLTIGGVEAVVLDRMPGQDINRQVVMVHGGRLYILTFALADEAAGDTYQKMEKLYTTVIDSFRFLPQKSGNEEGNEPALVWEGRGERIYIDLGYKVR